MTLQEQENGVKIDDFKFANVNLNVLIASIPISPI